MLRLVWMLVVLVALALAQKVVFSPGPCSATCSRTVDQGHIIDLTRPAHVEVFDRDGLRQFQAIVLSPAGRSISSVSSAAIDSDETVAVTAVWDVEHGIAGGIVLFDGSGKQTRVIETGRFVPAHVCFDQNHSIWVVAWQRDAEDWGSEDRADDPILRKFSKDGKEEARLVQRSRFLGRSQDVDYFRAAHDRIGMLIGRRNLEGESDWIEIDLEGKILGHWQTGKTWPDVAFTPNGHLYTRDRDSKTRQVRLAVFDRDAAKWQPLMDLDENPDNEINYGGLQGTDGNQLVFSTLRHDKLIWMQVK
jgi:hypothetical protein